MYDCNRKINKGWNIAYSQSRIYNNGDRINISQGDNIRHGEVVPGHKHDLIDKEVMSNKFFHLLETNI